MRQLCALLTALAVLAVTGCSHTVTIDSNPPGALISVNGDEQGTAPVQYKEKTGWEKAYTIEAKKDGKTVTREMKQKEWNMMVAGGSIGGAVVLSFVMFPISLLSLVGLAWSRQLPDNVTIDMNEKSSSGGEDFDPSEDFGY
jgi:hypothetical protein